MTDHEVLSKVLTRIDPSITCLRLVRRNGRVLLGLPDKRSAANRVLRLYQPQRRSAQIMVKILHYLVTFGLQRYLLPKTQIESDCPTCSPFASKIEVGSCGVLLGSPEHRVRRAIASYCNAGQWEVAKISFGEAGARVLEQEARILQELHPLAAGVPGMLGLHRGDDVMMLRMPYLTGRPIPRGAFEAALDLLNQWVTDQAAKSITEFPEWPSIESALLEHESSDPVIEKLLKVKLRPVICHGDFARWNLLRQENGKLIVLDWEWGHQNGMPGIDLAHYFLQDARLVERLSPQEAIRKTCSLLESSECRRYLQKTGWSGDPLLPIIASLAYKQGAGHQDNAEVLKAAVAACL